MADPEDTTRDADGPVCERGVAAADLIAEVAAESGTCSRADLERLIAAHPGLEAQLRRAHADHNDASIGLDALRQLRHGLVNARGPGRGKDAHGLFLEAGRSIGGFRLVRPLGSGGQAVVWEAVQDSMERAVALKVLSPSSSTRSGLRRFEQEARALSRTPHPGIVTVFERGESDGLHWIAQEIVAEGRSLADVLDEARRGGGMEELPLRRVAGLVADVAAALHVAHRAGVVHRDVKPQNILVGPDGAPKLADFGMAWVEGEALTLSGAATPGTVCYMSPEQLAPREGAEVEGRVGPQSDVFSLGLVLYELITLRRAFDGDSWAQVAMRITREEPVDIRVLRRSCPRDLRLICQKAIERKAQHRYADAAAFEADLRRYLAGEAVEAAPLGPVRRVGRLVERYPARMAIGALAAVALGTIVALLVGRARDALALTRLAALQDYQELMGRADLLWPPTPALKPEFEGWLEDARALVSHVDEHKSALAALRARLSAEADSGDSSLVDRWWERQLALIVESLESLRDDCIAGPGSPEFGWSVQRRLDFVNVWEARFGLRGDVGKRWASALPSIREVVPGFEARFGLVPLGRNPSTGLWEFWHIASGSEPHWRDGDIAPRAQDGIVLVLMPEAEFLMGAQTEDPEQLNYVSDANPNERPVHRVRLSAHLFSKFEVTQGQWTRLAVSNPSFLGPAREPNNQEVSIHPVECVSWNQAVELMERFDLALPSEAQWEHAARGLSRSSFPLDATEIDFFDRCIGNVRDRSMDELEPGLTAAIEDRVDSFAHHAPVGTFRANGFGIHDLAGNVSEFCRDRYDTNYYSTVTQREWDPVCTNAVDKDWITRRGGSFTDPVRFARVTYRGNSLPDSIGWNTGVRPVATLHAPTER